MKTRRLYLSFFPALVLLAGVPLGACTGPVGEDLATTSEAIYGDAPIDSTFKAVVKLDVPNGKFCSGTIVGTNLIMTAAHCFFALGEGCMTASTAVSQTTVHVTQLGDLNHVGDGWRNLGPDDVSFKATDIVLAANAFPRSTCPSSFVPSDDHVDSAHDVAFVTVAEDRMWPSWWSDPLPVMTAVDARQGATMDCNFSACTIPVDTDVAFAKNGVAVDITGFGMANATSAMCGFERRAAPSRFVMGSGWLTLSADKNFGIVQLEKPVGTQRILGSGDSGGPLLAIFGRGPVVIGVNSRSSAAGLACGATIPAATKSSEHAATFAPGMGGWIASMIASGEARWQAAHEPAPVVSPSDPTPSYCAKFVRMHRPLPPECRPE